ncbi:MAG: alpha/beta hydrolase fold domain-containing protein, partial [Ginsengibacter sp.]
MQKCVFKRYFTFLVLMAGIQLLASCNESSTSTDTQSTDSSTIASTNMSSDSSTATMNIQPAGPKPSWAPNIKPEMQAVIEKLVSYGDSPLVKLSAVDARKQHAPADAVKDLMQEHSISAPAVMSDTSGKDIDVPGGKIHLRIYTPKSGNGPFPVIVYYHGGGWVIANLDTYDASARSLADQTGAVLVSVA